MRLVRVPTQNQNPSNKRRATHRTLVVVWLCIALVVFQLARPLPKAIITLHLPKLTPATSPSIRWPGQGQAALMAEGYGLLATYGEQQPLATASIAKVITALCVLEKHPLEPGEAGPLITMGAADVGFYQQQVEQNGSRLPVYEGEELSEYQALQAILIPSANNIADTLALWAFKDSATYRAYANDFALRHGLVHTHVGTDASGYDPSTTSTAEDLAKLGLIAMQNATLMAIASQTSAVFPYAGEFTNYNTALGTYGITGLKTGNNEQNPGALLFTATIPLASENILVSGAVLGANSLGEAISSAQAIVESTAANFTVYPYIQKNQQVGTIRTMWGKSVPITSSSDITLVRWRGMPVTKHEAIHKLQAYGHSNSIGTVSIQSGEIQHSSTLRPQHTVPGPSVWWRLKRLR